VGEPALILLDTHALIWMALEPQRLSHAAVDAIRQNRGPNGLCISAITIWEMALLVRRGRIQVSGSLESFVYDTVARVLVRPISSAISVAAVSFPDEIPKDPADRLIAATSIVEAFPLVTADEKLRQSGLLQTIW
jgi:PIN domain nuclease of toxin-antitoxin system